MLYPDTEETLATQLRSTLCGVVVTAIPLPERASVEVEFDALLTKDAVAEEEPLFCGLKVTVNDALLPAAMVRGSCGPLRVNSLLLVPAEDTVTLDPLAVMVLVALFVAPTFTFPKLIDPGETLSEAPAAPLPERDSEILLQPYVIETFPLTVLAAVGAKLTANVTLCPAGTVSGVFRPLTLNPVPETEEPEIVTLAFPVFCTVPYKDFVLPTGTLPKERDVGLTVNRPKPLNQL